MIKWKEYADHIIHMQVLQKLRNNYAKLCDFNKRCKQLYQIYMQITGKISKVMKLSCRVYAKNLFSSSLVSIHHL